MVAPPPTSSSDASHDRAPHDHQGDAVDAEPPAEGLIRREDVDGAVVFAVSGPLDDAAGRSLVAALQSTLDDPPARIDIDLAEVVGFTAGGAAALGECRSYTDHLAEGLHYRTVQGPGQDAFLAAFE